MLGWFKRNTPARCNVRWQSGDLQFDADRDELLLSAAQAAGIAYPHNCRVGTCGQCKTKLVSGKVRPMMDFALSPLTAAELRDGYILACQSKLRSDVVIDVPLDQASVRQARVEVAQHLPGEVLSLQLALDQPLQFQAGQYAELAMKDADGLLVSRAYSFCDAPLAQGNATVSFLIKRLPGGALSDRLWAEARPGLALQLRGPFGRMGAADVDAHALCVAGGTGLAPVLSIVRDRLARSDRARFIVLLGVRRSTDQFAEGLLKELEHESQGRVSVRVVLSEEPADSPWPGDRGLVTELLTPPLLQQHGVTTAYVCGAAPMVQACQARLHQLGWTDDAIHTDSFAPSGATHKTTA